MSVTEFMECMQRKQRQNSLTSNISETSISVKNDLRTTNKSQDINIVFFIEEKLSTNVKRRYENQVPILKFCM